MTSDSFWYHDLHDCYSRSSLGRLKVSESFVCCESLCHASEAVFQPLGISPVHPPRKAFPGASASTSQKYFVSQQTRSQSNEMKSGQAVAMFASDDGFVETEHMGRIQRTPAAYPESISADNSTRAFFGKPFEATKRRSRSVDNVGDHREDVKDQNPNHNWQRRSDVQRKGAVEEDSVQRSGRSRRRMRNSESSESTDPQHFENFEQDSITLGKEKKISRSKRRARFSELNRGVDSSSDDTQHSSDTLPRGRSHSSDSDGVRGKKWSSRFEAETQNVGNENIEKQYLPFQACKGVGHLDWVKPRDPEKPDDTENNVEISVTSATTENENRKNIPQYNDTDKVDSYGQIFVTTGYSETSERSWRRPLNWEGNNATDSKSSGQGSVKDKIRNFNRRSSNSERPISSRFVDKQSFVKDSTSVKSVSLDLEDENSKSTRGVRKDLGYSGSSKSVAVRTTVEAFGLKEPEIISGTAGTSRKGDRSDSTSLISPQKTRPISVTVYLKPSLNKQLSSEKTTENKTDFSLKGRGFDTIDAKVDESPQHDNHVRNSYESGERKSQERKRIEIRTEKQLPVNREQGRAAEEKSTSLTAPKSATSNKKRNERHHDLLDREKPKIIERNKTDIGEKTMPGNDKAGALSQQNRTKETTRADKAQNRVSEVGRDYETNRSSRPVSDHMQKQTAAAAEEGRVQEKELERLETTPLHGKTTPKSSKKAKEEERGGHSGGQEDAAKPNTIKTGEERGDETSDMVSTKDMDCDDPQDHQFKDRDRLTTALMFEKRLDDVTREEINMEYYIQMRTMEVFTVEALESRLCGRGLTVEGGDVLVVVGSHPRRNDVVRVRNFRGDIGFIPRKILGCKMCPWPLYRTEEATRVLSRNQEKAFLTCLQILGASVFRVKFDCSGGDNRSLCVRKGELVYMTPLPRSIRVGETRLCSEDKLWVRNFWGQSGFVSRDALDIFDVVQRESSGLVTINEVEETTADEDGNSEDNEEQPDTQSSHGVYRWITFELTI